MTRASAIRGIQLMTEVAWCVNNHATVQEFSVAIWNMGPTFSQIFTESEGRRPGLFDRPDGASALWVASSISARQAAPHLFDTHHTDCIHKVKNTMTVNLDHPLTLSGEMCSQSEKGFFLRIISIWRRLNHKNCNFLIHRFCRLHGLV